MSQVLPFGVPFDARAKARALYWCAWDITDIAEALEIPRTTVQSWKDRGKWDEAPPRVKASECTYIRYSQLVMKEVYTPSDVRDIDLLGRQIERFEKIRRFHEPDGHTGDLNDKVANRNAGDKKKPVKNFIGREAVDKLVAAMERGMYAFQRTWWDTTDKRIRMLLKSRQIGATYSFARERLIRGLLTGNNQIFISASRNQANIFRQYIVEFVRAEIGVKLVGDPIVIERGEDADGNALEPVQLLFLGTNYRTAQGYHGDVIIDEFFWIYGFEQLYSVASKMATQKRYTVTLFSTPSTINHEAYPMWSGEKFNARRPKVERIRVDTSHDALKGGAIAADRIWRQIVTLQDAIDGGFDLIDADELKFECSIDEFANLFCCQFIDDSASTFPMHLIHPCLVDAMETWKDVNLWGLKPYAGDVWLGYDPNESEAGDNAALVAVAAPSGKKSKFRVLERIQLRGLDFEGQAAMIQKWCSKYRVTNIGIDATGCGASVWQLVIKFFPAARRLDYNPALKTAMVLKAKNVFANRRIELDAGMTDIARALMSIHPQLTKHQRQMTYVARRSAETGHGDLAWALLHALFFEPLDGADVASSSTVEIFDGADHQNGRGFGTGRAFGQVELCDRGVQLRRSGTGARPARAAGLPRNPVERPLVRTARQPVFAGARAQRRLAPSLGYRRQGQPAQQDVHAVQAARSRRVPAMDARLPGHGQRLYRAHRQPAGATAVA